MSDNLRGAGLMMAAMALFAVEDVFLKALAEALPVGQVLMLAGLLGAGVMLVLMRARGQPVHGRDLARPMVLLRSLAEAVTAAFFVAALAMGDLASASAILQALPLAMTLGAALWLGEKVGWRRWLSIALGFVGVLMIIRPGGAAFQPASLMAVAAVTSLAVRDLVTRRMPAAVSSNLLTMAAFAAVVPAGAVVTLAGAEPMVAPDARQAAMFAAAVGFGLTGYSLVVAATRIGDISVVAPFRYMRLICALVLAVVIFSERPDAMTLAGAAVIVASGGYAMWRETRARRRGG